MSLVNFRLQIAVEATSAGTALFAAESPAKSSSEDVAAERIADAAAAAVVVVAVGGSCSWRPAGFATDFAAAELERSKRKARSWAVAASDCNLLATSAPGHMAMKPDIGLVRSYIALALEPGHN